MFKACFTILKTPPPFSYKAQVKLEITCCVLHNYIRLYNNQDEYASVEEVSLSLDDEDDFYYVKHK